MEILDELIECEVALIVPYIGGIVQVCLEVGTKKAKIVKSIVCFSQSLCLTNRILFSFI